MSLTPRAPPILARRLSLLTAPRCYKICRRPSLVLADLWADRWIRFCPPTWMVRPCRPPVRPPRSSDFRDKLPTPTIPLITSTRTTAHRQTRRSPPLPLLSRLGLLHFVLLPAPAFRSQEFLLRTTWMALAIVSCFAWPIEISAATNRLLVTTR